MKEKVIRNKWARHGAIVYNSFTVSSIFFMRTAMTMIMMEVGFVRPFTMTGGTNVGKRIFQILRRYIYCTTFCHFLYLSLLRWLFYVLEIDGGERIGDNTLVVAQLRASRRREQRLKSSKVKQKCSQQKISSPFSLYGHWGTILHIIS